uniref:Parkin RING/Ubox like zinc-binding domain-containing protein n=1 Tax=Glossina palpalis gambiensis TaxID=67801 RepID=A0A1B0BYP9_9MUSC
MKPRPFSKLFKEGKLHVLCSLCKDDAFTMHRDREYWNYVLKCRRIRGRCESYEISCVDNNFGYIPQQINKLLLMCEPKFLTDSSLDCNKYIKFCRGRKLLIDFRNSAERAERIRYYTDGLNEGRIKRYCKILWSMQLRNVVVVDN